MYIPKIISQLMNEESPAMLGSMLLNNNKRTSAEQLSQVLKVDVNKKDHEVWKL